MYNFQESLTLYSVGAVVGEATSPAGVERLVKSGIGYNGLMAIGIIQSIPVFIMFLIFREQLMTGIKLRGFK